MFAQTIVLGRVGKDPELRYTSGGAAVANFSVAVTRKFKTSSGEQKEETTWYAVVAWKKLAEIIQQHVRKGDLVFISGDMQQRKWEDKQGAKRDAWELRADTVRFTGKRNGNSENAAPEVSDEDIPF